MQILLLVLTPQRLGSIWKFSYAWLWTINLLYKKEGAKIDSSLFLMIVLHKIKLGVA